VHMSHKYCYCHQLVSTSRGFPSVNPQNQDHTDTITDTQATLGSFHTADWENVAKNLKSCMMYPALL